MLKSFLKTSIYIACLTGSGLACAAGLGGINVTSALGQPLKAEITVLDADKTDISNIKATLASADTYKNAGVDYPFNVPKIKFEVEQRANGEPYVKVTTAQPVNEPFVTLLVELNWSSGKLLREYTFLLDPADYKAEQPKQEEVKPIEPVLAVPAVAPVPVAEPVAASEPVVAQPLAEAPSAVETTPIAASSVAAAPVAAAAPAPAPVAVAEPATEVATAPVQELAPASAPVAAPIETTPINQAPVKQDELSKEESIAEAAPAAAPSNQIVVMRGDTLAKIAAQIKPDNVSLERMLVTLYRENAGVFDAHNMNRIRAGKILNIPSDDSVQKMPQADAVEEIRAQAADWNVYRQKLASARMARAESAGKQEVAGKLSTAVTDKATTTKEPAKEVLKLSKGEAPNDKTVASGKSSAQEKAIAKEEEAIAKAKALKDAQERTALLEKNVKDLKKLAELKSASAPAAATAPAAVVTTGETAAAQPASSVVPAKPKPKVQIAAPKVVEQPSLIDQLMDEPLYLAGGAALLLALGGLGFVVARRGKSGGGKKKAQAKNKGDDVGSSTGRIAAPIAPSPDTGDFTHAAAQPAPVSTSADSEEVDPIGEADLFLTFGRDAQAEEVLKEALKKNPNNIPVKLKLLSIYATRKDTNSFYSYAREIKESGDESAWNQAVSMGRELDPSNPFYGGDASAAAPATARKPESAAPAVDFDLGFGAAAAAKPSFANQSTVVLETPNSQERTTIMSPEVLHSATQATPMDFDITGTNPGFPAMKSAGGEDTTALNMDDLVFDVTATHPRVAVPPTFPSPAVAAKDDGMTFTLDFPMESKPKAAPVPDLGLNEISLNMDNLRPSAGAGAAQPKDENWQEVATKLDLAKAYQEMGDAAGAREILEEVLRDGDDQQRESAQTLMQQL